MEEEKKIEAKEIEAEEITPEDMPKLLIPWGWVIFFGVLVSLAIFLFIMIMIL